MVARPITTVTLNVIFFLVRMLGVEPTEAGAKINGV
jgi:hypothetical protein